MLRLLCLLLFGTVTFAAETGNQGQGQGSQNFIDGVVVEDDEEMKKSLGIFGVDLVKDPPKSGEIHGPKAFKISYRKLKNKNMANSVLNYMWQYGFMEVAMGRSEKDLDSIGALVDRDAVTESVRLFQKAYNLRATGEIDVATLHLMKKPRCGVKDVFFDEDGYDSDTPNRAKRYVLSRKNWDRSTLRYWIDPNKITSDMKKPVVLQEITRALEMWAGVAGVTFVETEYEDNAHIKMSFEVGDHNDGYPFYGLGGTLAHAFYPKKGLLHFDDGEEFSAGVSEGTNLFFTAVHELGHILGIKHSDDVNAVMYPFYPGYSDSLELHDDDKRAAVAKLGPGKGTVKPLNYSSVTPDIDIPVVVEEIDDEPPDCYTKLDAAISRVGTDPNNPRVYVFSGQWYFKLKPKNFGTNNMPTLDTDFSPTRITEGFKGLPLTIDAAVEGVDDDINKVYFFKGDQYYIYDFVAKMVTEGPLPISELFEPSVDGQAVEAENLSVDGAFVHINNRKGITMGYISSGNKLNKFKYNAGKQVYTGNSTNHFDIEDRGIDATTLAFYRVWTWIFQGNWYTIAKSTDGSTSSTYKYRPIMADIKIPMCEEGVGELNAEDKNTCKKELKNVKQLARPHLSKAKRAKLKGFKPSAKCKDFIAERLPESTVVLPDIFT